MKAVMNGIILSQGKLLSGQVMMYEETIWKIVPRSQTRVGMCVEIIDAAGGFIVPGWIHMKVPFLDGEETQRGRLLASQGITAMVPAAADKLQAATVACGIRVLPCSYTEEAGVLPMIQEPDTAVNFASHVRTCLQEKQYEFTELMQQLSEVPAQRLGQARQGRLAVTYAADFVILDNGELQVQQTVVGGELVYDATDGTRILR